MSTCSVVLVDDAAEIRMLLKVLLEAKADVKVVGEAANGQEGVDLCIEHQPNVVVLDISMPVMDGLQALPLIREKAPETGVVMLSGFTTADIKDRAFELGAKCFVDKGTMATDIVDAVSGAC